MLVSDSYSKSSVYSDSKSHVDTHFPRIRSLEFRLHLLLRTIHVLVNVFRNHSVNRPIASRQLSTISSLVDIVDCFALPSIVRL